MNHIIHNISVILIFFGIIFLTYNLTKSYNKCPKQKCDKRDNLEIVKPSDRPSKVYRDMFKRPDVWMGYADFDTKTYQNKLL